MIEFVTLAMSLVQLGHEIAPLAQMVVDATAKTGGPEPADWDALHKVEAGLRARLAAETGAA